MKVTLLFCVLFAFDILAISADLQKSVVDCPENEILKDCNSHCNPKCKDPHGPLRCRNKCVIGCGCIEGYAKDTNGKCVKFSDCPGYQCDCFKKNLIMT